MINPVNQNRGVLTHSLPLVSVLSLYGLSHRSQGLQFWCLSEPRYGCLSSCFMFHGLVFKTSKNHTHPCRFSIRLQIRLISFLSISEHQAMFEQRQTNADVQELY